jgi:hypothetical protein
MSRVNGATGALSIGPSAGYTLFFVFVHVSLLFTAYASSYTHMHIHVITYIALIFWIKLKLKMPNFLTPLWSRLVLCFLYQVRLELSLLGPCPSVCSSSSADHRCSSGAATLCSRHAQSSARGALTRSPMVELLHQTAPVLATNPARPDP